MTLLTHMSSSSGQPVLVAQRQVRFWRGGSAFEICCTNLGARVKGAPTNTMPTIDPGSLTLVVVPVHNADARSVVAFARSPASSGACRTARLGARGHSVIRRGGRNLIRTYHFCRALTMTVGFRSSVQGSQFNRVELVTRWSHSRNEVRS